MSTDWEAHYREGDTPWDKGAPSPALLEVLTQRLLRGRVLVPGCGRGHDVRALAAAGLEAVGLDIARGAVAAAERLAKVGRETYLCADLFALPAELRGTFDAVWEHTCYCAISPELRPAYVQACAEALRPGGSHVGVFYLDPGQTLAADGPPFETRLLDLDDAFSGRFELVAEWPPRNTFPGREGREWVRHQRLRPIVVPPWSSRTEN